MGERAIIIGNAIRHYRNVLGMTQEELADKVGVDRLTISRWECGVTPRFKNLDKVAEVLNTTVPILFSGQVANNEDRVIAKLEYELNIVLDNLSYEHPSDLRSYLIGKKEALERAIRIIEFEREVSE